MSDYIHTPPPSSKFFIVYDDDQSIVHYGELTEAINNLGYNRDNIETYDVKQEWIDRLAELDVIYEEP